MLLAMGPLLAACRQATWLSSLPTCLPAWLSSLPTCLPACLPAQRRLVLPAPPLPAPPAAFRSGAVMGFLLAGNALLVLFLLLLLLKKVYGDDWEGMYEVGGGGGDSPGWACAGAGWVGAVRGGREPVCARCV